MSSSGIVSISSFNLLFLTQVLTVLTTTIKYTEYVTDRGKNFSIPCKVNGSIMWVKENCNGNSSVIIQMGSLLVFPNVTENDAGIYICLTTENYDIDISTANTSVLTKYSDIPNINEYKEYIKVKLLVRTTPGPVAQLYFKTSTILGFLVWRWNKTNTGGYPIRSFTAEYRYIPDDGNISDVWTQLDPPNISPNVRQMEVYKLDSNTTYEFRIWANNKLGSGVVVTANITTLPDTKEEDLVRLIKDDIENFDVRVWIAAVGIVLGSLVILAIGVCVLMAIECYKSSTFAKGYEDGWNSVEVIPNIIINPGFCDSDGNEPPYTRTIIFGEDDESDGYDTDSQSSMEKPMEVFKRKVSVFFTGQTIRRI